MGYNMYCILKWIKSQTETSVLSLQRQLLECTNCRLVSYIFTALDIKYKPESRRSSYKLATTTWEMSSKSLKTDFPILLIFICQGGIMLAIKSDKHGAPHTKRDKENEKMSPSKMKWWLCCV